MHRPLVVPGRAAQLSTARRFDLSLERCARMGVPFRRHGMFSTLLGVLSMSSLSAACGNDDPESKADRETEQTPTMEGSKRDAGSHAGSETGADSGKPDGGRRLDASLTSEAGAEPPQSYDASTAVEADGGGESDAGDLQAAADGGKQSDGQDAGRADAGVDAGPVRPGRPCRRPPADCPTLNTLILQMDACCTSTIECGYELVRPVELREDFFGSSTMPDPANPDSRCVSKTQIFKTEPGQEEERVDIEGGDPLFYTPECSSRTIGAYPLPGCCMASGTCGAATTLVTEPTKALVGFSPAPFERPVCLSAADINARFKETVLAGFGHIPETSGTCDYAGLVARHPAPEALP